MLSIPEDLVDLVKDIVSHESEQESEYEGEYIYLEIQPEEETIEQYEEEKDWKIEIQL